MVTLLGCELAPGRMVGTKSSSVFRFQMEQTVASTGRLRALVVDDEPLAGRRLARQLGRLGLDVVGTLESGGEVLARSGELAFEVAFLDIQMPGINGLETAARLTEQRDAAIVFVTAHDEHALAAFDVGAIDYVLKPVNVDRLAQAVRRLGSTPRTDAAEVIAASRRLDTDRWAAGTSGQPTLRLEVRMGTRSRYVGVEEIQRLFAADKYVMFTDAQGVQHVLNESLTQLELRLAACGFVRVHRRELIRLSAVEEVITRDRITVVALTNGERAQVSRRFAPKLRALLTSGS